MNEIEIEDEAYGEYVRALFDYLSANSLKPSWATGLSVYRDLPRLAKIKSGSEGYANFKRQFKYEIQLNSDAHEQDLAATIWIIENLEGLWNSELWGTFHFELGEDAMRFRMVWG